MPTIQSPLVGQFDDIFGFSRAVAEFAPAKRAHTEIRVGCMTVVMLNDVQVQTSARAQLGPQSITQLVGREWRALSRMVPDDDTVRPGHDYGGTPIDWSAP